MNKDNKKVAKSAKGFIGHCMERLNSILVNKLNTCPTCGGEIVHEPYTGPYCYNCGCSNYGK